MIPTLILFISIIKNRLSSDSVKINNQYWLYEDACNMCNHIENERVAVKGSGRLVRGFQEAGLTASDAQAGRWQNGQALARTQGKVMCTRALTA